MRVHVSARPQFELPPWARSQHPKCHRAAQSYDQCARSTPPTIPIVVDDVPTSTPPFLGFASLCIPVSPLFTHPDEFRVHRNYTYILQCLLARTLAPACNPAILLVLFIFNIYPNILNVKISNQ